MKKILLTILVCLMLTLSACSGQVPGPGGNPAYPNEQAPITQNNSAQVAAQAPAVTVAAATQASTGNAELTTSYENAVSVEAQLLIGTLKLTGTDQAVTKDQATVLLPLWKNLQTLSQSMGPGQGTSGQGQKQSNATPQPQTNNTEVQSQIDDVVKQIMAAMTPAQIQAIAEMKITQETAMSAVQELGITMGGPQQGGGNNAGSGNQPPQGTPPADGSGGNGDQNGNQPPSSGGQPLSGGQQPGGNGQQSGKGAQNVQNPPFGMGMMVPPPMIDALVQALEKIAAGETVTASTTSTTANQGGAPSGNPPAGAPSGNGSGDATSGLSTATGAYTLNGGTDTQTGKTYSAANQDQSGVYVLNSGNLTLNNVTVNTSGKTSSDENSSFYGLNAGVLAASGSTITMNGGTINTIGTGANGAFATGAGTTVNLSDVTITATGDGGHGVMATQGGAMTLTNVDMTTSGAHSAPIATDRGGGAITATGGTLNTSGQDSPCYYSTGTLTIANSTCNATGSEVAVIEGSNTVDLTNSNAISSVVNKWAVMIYQSFSGDAQGSDGIFSMTGGLLAYTDATGPLFYVTNTNGHITLKGVNVSATSGTLLKAEGNDRWGTSGSNGGTVEFIVDAQTLVGNFVADKISTLTLTLQNSSALTGAINAENTAKAVNLTLDSTSAWNVTADSTITCLINPAISGTTISNITGNGYTITYDSNACTALGGQTYTLKGGGYLTPWK